MNDKAFIDTNIFVYLYSETEEEAREISAEELTMLLSGIDFFKAHKTLYYKKVS